MSSTPISLSKVSSWYYSVLSVFPSCTISIDTGGELNGTIFLLVGRIFFNKSVDGRRFEEAGSRQVSDEYEHDAFASLFHSNLKHSGSEYFVLVGCRTLQ